MAKVTFKGMWEVLKDSVKGFSEHKVPKLAASLAYYTVFSIGPLLLVIISLAGFFLGREAVEGSIYTQLDSFVGKEAAAQIQEIVGNAFKSGNSGIGAIIGIVVLLIGATTMFGELQDSINTIWGLKPKPKQGIWVLIKNRLLSFGIIGVLGFLLLVSLAVTAVIAGLSDRIQQMVPAIGPALMFIITGLLTLAITTALFAVIFKVLPDAKMEWKQVWPGAIATSILFLIGKFGISFYIGKSDIGSSFGTAGSMIILLVWIYYSSIILYFGAEFTRAYDVKYTKGIIPNKYAVAQKTIVIDEGEPIARQVREQLAQPHAQFGQQEKEEKLEEHEEKQKHAAPKPDIKKRQPKTTLVYEQVYTTSHNAKAAKADNDGLYRIRVEEKKPTSIGVALAGLVLFFVNTAVDQSKEAKA
jgi:membrane protein